MLAYFSGYFKKHYFKLKKNLCLRNFWKKIGLLFVPTSGHTAPCPHHAFSPESSGTSAANLFSVQPEHSSCSKLYGFWIDNDNELAPLWISTQMDNRIFCHSTNLFRRKLIRYLGSGCGPVGRAVTFNTRGPRFKSRHRQNLY